MKHFICFVCIIILTVGTLLYQKRTENGFFATEDTENHGKEIPCPFVFSVAHKNDQFVPVCSIASEPLAILEGHENIVTSASFSLDGTKIVTSSWDKTAKIWDAESGEKLLTLTGHTSTVSAAAFSPDGKKVVTGSTDSTARIWDAESGKLLHTLETPMSFVFDVIFTPDGTRVITANSDTTAHFWGYPSTLLKVWDVESGKRLEVLTMMSHWYASSLAFPIAFSPDGQEIIVLESNATASPHSGIWNVNRSEVLQKMARGSDGGAREWEVAYSPCGKNVVRISSVPDYRHRNFFATPVNTLSTERNERMHLPNTTSTVFSVAFSPDSNKFITANGDGTARIFGISSGDELNVLEGHTDVVISARFSSDGKKIVTASADHTARIWVLE